MATAAEILTANDMQNANAIVSAAQTEGLDIAIAATLIAGESWGKHVWGSDGVETGGTYTKGGPVTESNYRAYRDAMKSGRIGRQGCGPAQCTSAEYQDRADQLGGCWDIVANCRSGFRGLKALMDRYGTRDGARRYNGSGDQAEAYADRFMDRLTVWQDRLRGATSGSSSGADLPTLRRGDRSEDVRRFQDWSNWYAWNPPLPVLDETGYYGDQTTEVVRRAQIQLGVTGSDADGTIIGSRTNAALAARGYPNKR